ncbi:head-tail connector protein [Aurantiacibacter suaedae]|uniref:head-tail connector protein n=1 Tax=Aurantiacibacter suaedae TaxID=2545755 RepID=UPI0010F49831|nr:hypothetical protein [Aurantiacibacter suaedae]
MQRQLVTPPDLAGAALAELKAWLAITTARDDAELTRLLAASLATCEAFTGRIALEATYEEMREASTGWQTLDLTPVRAILAVEALASDASRTTLPPTSYLVDITARAEGRFRLVVPVSEKRLVVRYTAGLAADWDLLPADLCHGVLRLAAHHFRAREDDSAKSAPPAAVAALWQPWRRMRLA